MGEGLAAPGGESSPPKTGRGTLIKGGGRRKFSSAHAINHRLRFALVTPTLIALIVGCWARRGIIRPQPDKDDGRSGFFFKKEGLFAQRSQRVGGLWPGRMDIVDILRTRPPPPPRGRNSRVLDGERLLISLLVHRNRLLYGSRVGKRGRSVLTYAFFSSQGQRGAFLSHTDSFSQFPLLSTPAVLRSQEKQRSQERSTFRDTFSKYIC